MFLLKPSAVPDGIKTDTEWLRWTAAGLRTGFWSLWIVWLAQLFAFFTGVVLPLVTPKLKQKALLEVAAWAEVVALALGVGFVVMALLLARPPDTEGALARREGALASWLRRALVPLWAGWWTLTIGVLAAQRFDVEVPALAVVGSQILFAAAAVASLGYLSRLASALGQRGVATVAAIMAVYAMLPLELETAAYPLVGEPDWKSWLPIMSAGRLAAWMVVFGGGLIVCGRLRRLLKGVDA